MINKGRRVKPASPLLVPSHIQNHFETTSGNGNGDDGGEGLAAGRNEVVEELRERVRALESELVDKWKQPTTTKGPML